MLHAAYKINKILNSHLVGTHFLKQDWNISDFWW